MRAQKKRGEMPRPAKACMGRGGDSLRRPVVQLEQALLAAGEEEYVVAKQSDILAIVEE